MKFDKRSAVVGAIIGAVAGVISGATDFGAMEKMLLAITASLVIAVIVILAVHFSAGKNNSP